MRKIFVLILLITFFLIAFSMIKKSLTPEEVLEQKDTLTGKAITVIGKADVSPIIRCTLLLCPPDNECCNFCSGALVLWGEKEKITLTGNYLDKTVVCSGSECEITCYPLERNKTYKINGIWKRELNDYYLQLTGFSVVG